MQAIQGLPEMRQDAVRRAVHRRNGKIQVANERQRRCLRGQARHLQEELVRVRFGLRQENARAA